MAQYRLNPTPPPRLIRSLLNSHGCSIQQTLRAGKTHVAFNNANRPPLPSPGPHAGSSNVGKRPSNVTHNHKGIVAPVWGGVSSSPG
eukprot:5904307-Lingulodinium_polyedra.AAC.1